MEKTDVRHSFYEFVKQYATISDNQLNMIKEMEEMVCNGYKLKFFSSRRGTELRWVT